MITRITGVISSVDEHLVVLEADGIGYEIHVPSPLQKQMMGRKGEKVTLHTYHYLQGGAVGGNSIPVLIGFEREADREFFERFITVAGVGPRAAIKAFAIPTSRIARAIESGDLATLVSLPGIGRQRAGEIIAKLKGKVFKFALMKDERAEEPEAVSADVAAEALEVLLQLGYRRGEAEELIRKVLKESGAASTEELIQEIYRSR